MLSASDRNGSSGDIQRGKGKRGKEVRAVAGVCTSATLRTLSDRGAMSVNQQTGRDRVHQAARMAKVQADCTFAEALVLLRDRAEVSHRSLWQIADAVVERRIQFGG